MAKVTHVASGPVGIWSDFVPILSSAFFLGKAYVSVFTESHIIIGFI